MGRTRQRTARGNPLWEEAEQRPRRLARVDRLVIHLGVPLLIVVINGPTGPDLLPRLVSAYLQRMIVCSSISGTIECLYHLAPRLIHRPLHGLPRYLAHGVVIATGVLLGGELGSRAVALAYGVPLGPLRAAVWRAGFAISVFVVTVLLGYDRLRARAWRLRLSEELSRLAAVRAELTALQARTNPHFLFNSFNSVAGLIAEDPPRAEVMVERLAALFRYVLESSQRTTVPLQEELAAVQAYLAIEAIRFEGRLQHRVEVAPDLGGIPVPPLVLQPLVENAVLHGIASQSEPGTIAVEIERRGGILVLSVSDDAAGTAAGAPGTKGSGSALADLQARLALLYGGRASLEHGPRSPRGYRAVVTLPLAAVEAP